jgi:hypothetical protein
MKKILLLTIVTALLFSSGTAARKTREQLTSPPIAVSVALNKTSYTLNEPITAVISLEIMENNIITDRGFSTSPFHLYLEIRDPDNMRIIADEIAAGTGEEPLSPGIPPKGGQKFYDKHTDTSKEPPPPRIMYYDEDNDGDVEPVQVMPVEILSFPEEGKPWTLVVQNIPILEYYTLRKTGTHSIKAVVPFTSYKEVLKKTAEGSYTRIDAIRTEGHLESNTTYFTVRK